MLNLPERVDSTFRYVLLVARRAEQLMRGAHPKLPGLRLKPVRLAMAELQADRIEWDYGPAPETTNAQGLESANESEASS